MVFVSASVQVASQYQVPAPPNNYSAQTLLLSCADYAECQAWAYGQSGACDFDLQCDSQHCDICGHLCANAGPIHPWHAAVDAQSQCDNPHPDCPQSQADSVAATAHAAQQSAAHVIHKGKAPP